MKQVNKIAFASGQMEAITAEYYDLQLFSKEGKRVYAATLGQLDAAEVMNKYNNITLTPKQ